METNIQSISQSWFLIVEKLLMDPLAGLANVHEGRLKIREMSWKCLRKQMCFQSLAECGQRLSFYRLGRQVVPGRPTCGNNWKGTVGDSWQPDRRHYQAASVGRTKRSTAGLVNDAIEWSEVFVLQKHSFISKRRIACKGSTYAPGILSVLLWVNYCQVHSLCLGPGCWSEIWTGWEFRGRGVGNDDTDNRVSCQRIAQSHEGKTHHCYCV